MITAAEIQKKAQALYPTYLESVVAGESFFPYPIRSNKQVSADFLVMQREMAEVAAGSTDRKGYGYTVLYESIQTRRHGLQNLPASIIFATERDYLKFIGREREVVLFRQNLNLICRTLPALKEWCLRQVRLMLEEADCWVDLLKVCSYFVLHPCPGLYIRELPIEVHTKFIEQHIRTLQSLLNHLLPEEAIRQEEKSFCSRFYLKEAEPMVRFRLLDTKISNSCFMGIDDLSTPISQFTRLHVPCKRVFMVENLMTFLTFPAVSDSLVIWGKGFQVEILKDCRWLDNLPLVYWGDMDVHGFQILSQVRSYFPQTVSLMMDRVTFDAFSSMIVVNVVPNPPEPTHLTPEEMQLFDYLKENALRLEQEKIGFAYGVKRIKEK
ncbi:MAG: DUF2220 family protein [Tannerellaceae bacterium]